MAKTNKTNIQIDVETKAQIIAEGKMDESYDQVIKRLLAELFRRRDGKEDDG